MRPPPLIVLEDRAVELAAAVEREVASAGWRLVTGWGQARSGVVCTGRVDGEEAASAAVLAALSGAGLIVRAGGPRDVVDRLCDDLRRLGRLDHRVDVDGAAASLGPEERAVLELLLSGASLAEAARALHLSRRTADRRLAHARQALAAASTAEALATARRAGLRPSLPAP